ncbi:hypothetical protein HPB49_009195 [Dermacentor silvarum]|uniref:Uncharacterized protein n=1 Tax=Dermacentor silvarum TaxID=543639 RepID=A0ACB8DY40_DERSI|nr:hypothetical protein HPB49_009195 [Dermacentor silvarum]
MDVYRQQHAPFSAVVDGGPAALQGMHEGDLIIQVGKHNVQDLTEARINALLAQPAKRLEVFIVSALSLRAYVSSELDGDGCPGGVLQRGTVRARITLPRCASISRVWVADLGRKTSAGETAHFVLPRHALHFAAPARQGCCAGRACLASVLSIPGTHCCVIEPLDSVNPIAAMINRLRMIVAE